MLYEVITPFDARQDQLPELLAAAAEDSYNFV